MDNGEWAMGLHSNYPLSILHFPLNRHDFFILVSKHIFNLFDNFFVITWHELRSISLWKGDRVSDDNCDDSDDNLFVVTVFCGIFSAFIC